MTTRSIAPSCRSMAACSKIRSKPGRRSKRCKRRLKTGTRTSCIERADYTDAAIRVIRVATTFFELAERFRAADDPEQVKRLAKITGWAGRLTLPVALPSFARPDT